MAITSGFTGGARPSDGAVALALILAVINRPGNPAHEAETLRGALSMCPQNSVGILANARDRLDAMLKDAESAGTRI